MFFGAGGASDVRAQEFSKEFKREAVNLIATRGVEMDQFCDPGS